MYSIDVFLFFLHFSHKESSQNNSWTAAQGERDAVPLAFDFVEETEAERSQRNQALNEQRGEPKAEEE